MPTQKKFPLTIAELNILLSPTGNNWEFKPYPALEEFKKPGQPDLRIRAYYGLKPQIKLSQKIFDSGGAWSLFKNNSHWIFALGSPMTGPQPYSLVKIDREFKNASIYLRSLEKPLLSFNRQGKPLLNALEYPLDELLMVNLLAKKKGILVHACGIIYQNNGYLFLGTSGAGKSTMAKLLHKNPGVHILNDDRIIIRKAASQYWIYGTPWHGDAGIFSTGKAPLKRIYFLKKAKEIYLKKVGYLEAASRLLVCAFPTFWDKEGMKFSLSFCQDLALNCPVFEAEFLPDDSVYEFINLNA